MSASQFRVHRTAIVAAFVIPACLAVGVGAQMTDPNMQPAPYMQPADPNAPPASGKKVFKQLFAGTLAAVLQASGVGLATGLTTAMSGAIQNWFNKPPKAPGMDAAAAGMGGMPTSPDLSMGGMTAAPGMPMGMPQPMTPPDMNAMPAMPPGMNAMPAAPAAMPSLYAGLAYEVQAIRNGQAMTVDPATHSFATGERFVVMYRPSLPGQVAIYNVNPLGQETQIDAVNVAAGELTRLGPYEFRATTGREVLRLILSPCRDDGLMATTRDIVKVDEMSSAPAGVPVSGALVLPNCSVVAARTDRPQTRDIVKVDSEDGTMFALDPVSQQEIQAGSFTPRELTLTFTHR